MASIENIRRNASDISDAETREVCLRIVDEVSARIANARLGDWTIHAISKWVNRTAEDEILNRCIQLLSSRRDAKLFDMHFLYIDPLHTDSIGEPIDDAEVTQAYKEGFLVDPISGEQISDFEQALVPYFVASVNLD